MPSCASAMEAPISQEERSYEHGYGTEARAASGDQPGRDEAGEHPRRDQAAGDAPQVPRLLLGGPARGARTHSRHAQRQGESHDGSLAARSRTPRFRYITGSAAFTFSYTIFLRSCRSMDRMLPSEGSDAGSTPAKSTTRALIECRDICALGACELLHTRQESKAAVMSFTTDEVGSRVLMSEAN